MAGIHDCIKTADVNKLKGVIEEFPKSINDKDERGFPAIVLATYGQQVEITKLLIDAGVDIDQQDRAGNTALMGVTYKGNDEIVQLLIEAGANVNATNFSKATPLIYAATFGQHTIAKLLLANGADTTAKDGNGNSAIENARLKEDKEMEELLTV